MATKISTSSLRVTIHEQIRLKGQEHGTKNVCYVPDIATVSKRIIDVPTSEVVVASFSTAVAAGTFIESDVMYIRITNLDDTNAVELAVIGAATLYQVTLAAGQSHMLGGADDLMLAEADTSPSFGTMADISSLQVNPGTNAVDIEVFIAST